MAQRVLECQKCGVVYIALGNNAKYCKTCSRQEKLERDRVNHRRQRQIHACDPVEVIDICLHCTKEDCAGICEDVRREMKR